MSRPTSPPIAVRPNEQQQAAAHEPAARTLADQHLSLMDTFSISAGGFGNRVNGETARFLAQLGYRPAGRLGFDLNHTPQPVRTTPEGLVYSLSAEELCLYGQEDPRTRALATAAGRELWLPRLRGRDVRSTWDAAGGHADEVFGGLQLYLEGSKILERLARAIEGILVPERAGDNRFHDLRDNGGDADGPVPEKTFAVEMGQCGTVGRSLAVPMPYLIREAATQIFKVHRVERPCRIRIIGFVFGPEAFRGLHQDTLLNWMSALADFDYVQQHGFRLPFADRPPIESHGIGYDELYAMDGPTPGLGAERLSDHQLRDFEIEAGREVALRLMAPIDGKAREILDNPRQGFAGQAGFIRTLRARGLASPDSVVRGLVGSAQAGRILDELERRAAST